VDKGFETVLEKAKIGDFRFHDLRHYVRVLVHDERRRSLRVAKILWHSNIKMTEGYAKLTKSQYREDRQHRPGDVGAHGRREAGTGTGDRVMFPYSSLD
jgi:integrase